MVRINRFFFLTPRGRPEMVAAVPSNSRHPYEIRLGTLHLCSAELPFSFGLVRRPRRRFFRDCSLGPVLEVSRLPRDAVRV